MWVVQGSTARTAKLQVSVNDNLEISPPIPSSYLTGSTEPDHSLLIDLKTGHSKLIIPFLDDDYVLWCGEGLNASSAKEKYGTDEVLYQKDVVASIQSLLAEGEKIYVIDGTDVKPLGALGGRVDDSKLRE
ncbi:hypothetical protein BDK51DRAFT_51231 [Blyttiomyces helicus]|uniref:Aminopeptidase P N-terminal domain-containing protein n=1 Tax=Blyttiomyces helicus TaxID=388810 RepID=A0A4V1IPU0_9FUNG|nr:hypothetical protein BDK51DRAFT_51231 [Blyttiomyces helicus]|eukprot:RKO84227.1 hypothetical protein BDK51DRAFT_51231 [Blyttiomyces helicus]